MEKKTKHTRELVIPTIIHFAFCTRIVNNDIQTNNHPIVFNGLVLPMLGLFSGKCANSSLQLSSSEAAIIVRLSLSFFFF